MRKGVYNEMCCSVENYATKRWDLRLLHPSAPRKGAIRFRNLELLAPNIFSDSMSSVSKV